MTAREQRVSSPEGRAEALGDAHQRGTQDAVREATRGRRAAVCATRLGDELRAERELRNALAHIAHLRSPRGRLELVRKLASSLSSTAGEVLRDEMDERELRLAEDDVMGAIAARRAAQ